MQIQGSLKELKLPDILQLASMSKETCIIDFVNPEGVSGCIVFTEGQLSYAKVMDLEGEEAVFEIAIWFDGKFNSTKLESKYPVNISMNLTGILMEAARRLDEWRVLSRKIPSLSYYPHIIDEGTNMPTLNTAEWDILKYIDGSKTLREVAAESGESPFRVSKLIYGLLINSLLGLSQAPTAQKKINIPKQVKETGLKGKLKELAEEAKKYSSGEFSSFLNKAVKEAMVTLDKDPANKSVIIDVANRILKELMLFEGKQKSKELAESFKAILKGRK